MISFITHNYRAAKRKEIWFFNGEKVKNEGYTVYIAAKNKPADRFVQYNTQTTGIINLLPTEEALLENIHTGTRYDIKMGEKLHLKFHCRTKPDRTSLQTLARSYNAFAKQKKITVLKMNWLLAATNSGALHVTTISDGIQDISTHLYLADDREVILTHSFHNIKYTNNTARGYANKLLHWKDIIHFKKIGLTRYNFGGINRSLQGISDFKARFGAEISDQYSYILTGKLIGLLAAAAKKIK